MVKMDPENQVHTVGGPSFLSLSVQVRNMIYRLLLVADKPLGTEKYAIPTWAKFGRYDLQPAILGVCSQVYREASPILNGENTFGIYISGDEDPPYTSYSDSEWDEDMDREDCILEHHDGGWVNDREATTEFMNFPLNVKSGGFGTWKKRVGGFEGNGIIRRFQRLEILMTFAEPQAIRLHAKTLCNSILRKMPALRHVCIRVANDTSDTNNTALGPFGMLRNMRSVVIHGVPLPLAECLRSLMLGNTPPYENVEEMYDLLEEFVKDMKGNRFHLLKAYFAMLDWDVQEFKEFRSTIISEIQDRMDLLLLHMFDHDVKSEQDHQAETKESCDGNVGEDRDGKPGDD